MRAARTQRTNVKPSTPTRTATQARGRGRSAAPARSEPCQTFNTDRTHSDSDLSALPQPWRAAAGDRAGRV